MKVIVAVTGASGIPYATTLLRELDAEKHLVISRHARSVIERESDAGVRQIESMAEFVYDPEDMTAPMSSGGSDFDAMVIVPCSMSTLSKIACGIGDNLICRAASVMLKEGRKLILVPRETPLSPIHLANMKRLADCGAVVLAAMPPFYTKPSSVQDLVDFIVGKILESLGLQHDLYRAWD